jgi:DNA-binding HxlR family transcriptional regulator
MMGKRRFSEFLVSGEGIKTNVLTERLRRLERTGLVERTRYQAHPPRFQYRLTRAGRDLSPVLKAVFAWGRAHVPGAESGPSIPSRG